MLSNVKMVFMGCGLTSGGQESAVRLVQLCTNIGKEALDQVLPLVPKIKRSCFSVKGPLCSCLFIGVLPSRSKNA